MFPGRSSPTRVIRGQRGWGYCTSGVSPTVGAALAQDTLLFTLRNGVQTIPAGTDPNAQLQVVLQRLRLAFTTIVAFTTPVTAGRRITLHRASNAAAAVSAGTALAIAKKDTRAPASGVVAAELFVTDANGITAGGIVVEAEPLATLDLTHVGAVGGRAELLLEHDASGNPLCLNAGQYIIARNPVAMDAGGTFQLSVLECEWHEQRADEVGL